MKSYNFKEADLENDEIFIEIKNKLLDPDTTHYFTIQVLNANKTVIWEQDIVIKSKRELTEEQQYQEDMANIAFKAMIDNLLKALGAQPEE